MQANQLVGLDQSFKLCGVDVKEKQIHSKVVHPGLHVSDMSFHVFRRKKVRKKEF